MSGAATSVCQQSLADSLGEKQRGPGVELRSATGHQFATTGNTAICLRTRDSVNVAGDFQIAPKNIGLQKSIISVGHATKATSSLSAAQVKRYSMSSLATVLSLNVLAKSVGCEPTQGQR